MKRILARLHSDPAGTPSRAAAGSTSTDIESDILLYYSFVEQVLQRGAMEAADRFLAPDFVEHGPDGDSGRSEFVERIARRFADRPDATWTIELLVSVGALVLCHSTITTGSSEPRRVSFDAWENVVARFTGGRIVEIWRMYNNAQVIASSQ